MNVTLEPTEMEAIRESVIQKLKVGAPAPDMAGLIETLRNEIRGVASPWKSRKSAAAYLGVNVSEIDRAAGKGLLTKKFVFGSPRFHVAELDKLVTTKKQSVRKEGA